MSTISKESILAHLERAEDPLIISPLLSRKQVGRTSVDVRLGDQFIVFRAYRLLLFESFGHKVIEPRRIQERQILRFGEPFALHPGVLMLGCTFEYVAIPTDLECQVEGRSSLARLGLQVVTASSVEPGFKGVITLELSNVGTVPLTLMPGVRIAQLVFRTVEPPIEEAYGGRRKYQWPIGPEFSRLEQDFDWKVLSEGGKTI